MEVVNIIKNAIENNPGTINQKEIIDILGIILEQNYFEFNKQFYKQNEGLAMGAPTSAILADIHIEHKQLYPILLKQKNIGYFRYVDDIFNDL
jgi:hypothetical protein